MLRCGLKITHDASIAVANDDDLLFSIELEKLANNIRWVDMDDLRIVEDVLANNNISTEDVDAWIVDGWVDNEFLSVRAHGTPTRLDVAGYRENSATDDCLKPHLGNGLLLKASPQSYLSYTHVMGHVLSAWMTSPFTDQDRGSVLVWDGGVEPRLYEVNTKDREIIPHGPLFYLLGHAYSVATKYFGPFKSFWGGSYDPWNSVAGRMMAYIGLGSDENTSSILKELYSNRIAPLASSDQTFFDYRRTSDGKGDCGNAELLYSALAMIVSTDDSNGANILRGIHNFLEEMLVSSLDEKLRQIGFKGPVDLCFAGGCALNIKWNRALSQCSRVKSIYVPPFANDSGAAIGGIACDLFRNGHRRLNWNVYSGPKISSPVFLPDGWTKRPCTPAELAQILYETGEPVVFLQGRAELGPRALGHRSILADPRSRQMKERLNSFKGREWYRPVAPICLEHHSSEIFDPGGRDPYMLFDHNVRQSWRNKIPAVLHVDGSARLQTVSSQDDPVLFDLLSHFAALSSVPVLCNTSANFSGRGFFPDLASAAEWGMCRYIWLEHTLYQKDS
jgi:carbamoyltransferase